MSQVVSEFRTAVGTAVNEPLHALFVFAVTVLGGVLGAVLGFIPLIGPLVNGVVVGPLIAVAVVGSAHGVRNGDTPFDGATAGVKRSGVDVMVAYSLLMAAYLAVWIGIALVGAVLLFTAGARSGMGASSGVSALTSALGVVGVIAALVVLLAFVIVGMAVQFVVPAAVVAGTGPVESLKTSFRFLRRNILGVTGFSLSVAALGFLGLLLVGLLWAIGRAADPTVGLALAGIGYLLAIAGGGAITSLYLVGYFETVVDAAALPADHEWPGDSGPDVAVGEVSTAGSTTSDGDADDGGFDVTMAGEDQERGADTTDETTPTDATDSTARDADDEP